MPEISFEMQQKNIKNKEKTTKGLAIFGKYDIINKQNLFA